MSAVIARRYALALINLAAKSEGIEEVAGGLDDLADLLAESDRLAAMLASPDVPHDDKERIVASVLQRIQSPQLVDTFVRYLAHKRRIELVTEIRRIYHELADERLGLAQAEVTVASPLSDGEEERLRTLYEKVSGKKITLAVTVDPSIIGGVVTRIGSTVWDGSLRNALDTLQSEISGG